MEGFRKCPTLKTCLTLCLVTCHSSTPFHADFYADCITMIIFSEPNAMNDSSIKMIKSMHVFQFHTCFKHGVSVIGLKVRAILQYLY